VHTNSGIANHWFYLLVNGGQNSDPTYATGTNVVGIGLAAAEPIAFLGFTALPADATFCDARAGTIAVAGTHDANVADAWDEVGVDATLCEGGNAPPTADFTYTSTELTVDFTDSSTDSDGSVVGWDWDFGDGNTSTAQNPSHTYGADGTYTVSLTVTDDDGATDTTSQDVTVSSGSTNNPPTADFTYTTSDLTVDFTDSSTDSDGSVVGWDWDFGDGNTSTAQNPSHTYAADGAYTVSLTVTDDDGATDTTSQDVTVSSGGDFTLTATGYKVRGRHHVDLAWSGATSTDVDVYRDGSHLTATPNDGEYTDATNNVGGGSYTYQVCEAGTSTCSNEATVNF
jgi:PKD repeat protein